MLIALHPNGLPREAELAMVKILPTGPLRE
jgi:hypothetical protein